MTLTSYDATAAALDLLAGRPLVVLTGAGHGFSSGADHKSAGAVPHVEGLTRPSFGLRSMECSTR